MKKIITLLILGISLASCKMTETYVVVGTETVIIQGVIMLPTIHEHTIDESDEMCSNRCFWITEWEHPYTDTVEIELFKKKRKFN